MNRADVLVRDLCAEIDFLRERLETSQENEKYWRDKYNTVLNDSIKHGEAMMGETITALLKCA